MSPFTILSVQLTRLMFLNKFKVEGGHLNNSEHIACSHTSDFHVVIYSTETSGFFFSPIITQTIIMISEPS